MTYPEALQYLGTFINYERLDDYNYKRSFRLERMRRLAALLGNPHEDIRSIHIAGTKGKGSTASIIHSILKAAGFKVGLYTSPHLVDFRERIKINDSLVGEDDISRLLGKIKAVMPKMGDEALPSFFEIYTAIAYLYFKEKRIDYAVYETGLGGRLDATNIIEPIVSVITPISYEHTDKLGPTLSEIAAEKAGIIKKSSICVSAPQEEEALEAIKETCERRASRLILVGKDVTYEEMAADERGEFFNASGLFGGYQELKMNLLGSHQVVNAATAIGAIEAMRLKGLTIDPKAVPRGIASARWEGRMEIVSRSPYIVLDGAQNRASANALRKAVKKIFRYKNLILILGVSKDKDIKGIAEELLPIADSIILTKSRVAERALEPAAIKEYMDPGKSDIVLTASVGDAIIKADLKAAQEDLILITGSLFVVGEAKELFGKIRNV